jgi:cholesterol transport system auxiliary component
MSALRKARCAVMAVAASLSVSSCALLTKSDPVEPRYYTPEPLRAAEDRRPPAARPDPHPAVRLRLRAVNAGIHLKQRIVYRESPTELGFYEERRWAELPEDYLRRLLAESLFEAHGVQRVVAGPAPTMEVELAAFEEVRHPRRVGRVQIVFLLHDGNVVRLEETVTVERPITAGAGDEDASADAAVRALSEALGVAVEQIVARTLGELKTLAPQPPSPVPEPAPVP